MHLVRDGAKIGKKKGLQLPFFFFSPPLLWDKSISRERSTHLSFDTWREDPTKNRDFCISATGRQSQSLLFFFFFPLACVLAFQRPKSVSFCSGMTSAVGISTPRLFPFFVIVLCLVMISPPPCFDNYFLF